VIRIFGRKYDVITIGSATLDHFITVNKKYKDIGLGDKILIDQAFIETGGGACNAAISLANMGLKVRLITKLGKDHNASIIEKNLKEKNVAIHKISTSRFMTPFSIILVSKKDKDRIVFAYKGSSDYLNEKDFSFKELNTSWIYLGSLLGKGFDTAENIADYAKNKNIKILFNPSTYVAAKGKKKLKKILNSTKILILNKEESQLILGRKLKILELLIGLKNLGPDIVVITDGKNPINAIDDISTYKVIPYKVKIVSTLGAGDAFASGFLGSFIINNNIETSLRIGLANAASVLQKYGATADILTYRAAIEFIKKHRSKLKKHRELKW